jgi:hypothetical protein
MADKINRRAALATIGTVTAAALAGCSSSEASDDDANGDDEYQNASGDGSDDDGYDDVDEEPEVEDEEDDEPDPDEVENREAGTDVLEFGDLHVIEFEEEVDEREFGDDRMSIKGIVENTGDEKYDRVRLSVRVYDHDGHQLDVYSRSTTDLQGEGTWRFDVPLLEDADEIGDYDIAVTGRRYNW